MTILPKKKTTRDTTNDGAGPSHQMHAPPSPESHSGYNSGDEYGEANVADGDSGADGAPMGASGGGGAPSTSNNSDEIELERVFESNLKDERGLLIKHMGDDGACLFRAVADQVYGDEEMHDVVRQNCMDFMCKNRDFYSQYITEDFDSYILRKRLPQTHGNHLEMQAIAELYNRTFEVYQYSLEPINVFHGMHKTDNAPIRVSYHSGSHYNSVVDPYNATVGVGLGLPSFQPGLADKMLVDEAMQKSEQCEIEQTMLKDKLRATDFEATSEAIEEQVARESYLEWVREQEKIAKMSHPSTSGVVKSGRPGTSCDKPPGGKASTSTASTSGAGSIQAVKTQGGNKHNIVATEMKEVKNSGGNAASCAVSAQSQSTKSNAPPSAGTRRKSPAPSVVSDGTPVSSDKSSVDLINTMQVMNELPPSVFGFSDWEVGREDDDLLAQVLAASQQEYLDNLKKQAKNGQDPGSSSWGKGASSSKQ